MFNKRRRRNPFLFTVSMLGAGAAAFYLTKEARQGQDRDNTIYSYSPDHPVDYSRNEG
ncbi:hypothetical protein [uncultured Metabacillus sp.]|uniref:hypothetical protein n=1 Tax=Metabacillus sp. Hm71 TaxID=3450743 RepID=UPI00261B9D7B|nr:hypothetical protein [uncultured Metabacillus sp.]